MILSKPMTLAITMAVTALFIGCEPERPVPGASCTSFEISVSRAEISIGRNQTGTVEVRMQRIRGFDPVNLGAGPSEGAVGFISETFLQENVLGGGIFETELRITVGENAVVGETYRVGISGENAKKPNDFCNATVFVTVAEDDCPSETCLDDSFLVLGESCIAETDAINADNLLQNPGFETDAFGANFPTTDGGWSGDGVTQVSSENGITPAEGSQMLRFDFADVDMSSALAGSEIAQLYVLPQELKDSVNDGGSVTIRQEAFFNRIEGDANTDTEFIMLIIAFDGATADFANDYLNRDTESLASASNSIKSDACPNTWERLGAEITIPMNTNYIGVVLVAAEDVENDTTGIEFDGHYVDAASLFILK